MHIPTNEPWSHTKNQVSQTYITGQNPPPKKKHQEVAVNGHFEASWASQPVAACSCTEFAQHDKFDRQLYKDLTVSTGM